MKTAISIPDDVFEAAERLARDLKISRSELYTKAVRALVDARDHARITETLNRVYENDASALDAVLAKLQAASLPKEAW